MSYSMIWKTCSGPNEALDQVSFLLTTDKKIVKKYHDLKNILNAMESRLVSVDGMV